MRLRTQILLLVIALCAVAGFGYEALSRCYLAPEFARHGLETASLLGERERTKIERLLELAETQAQMILGAGEALVQQKGAAFEALYTYRLDGQPDGGNEGADVPRPPTWILSDPDIKSSRLEIADQQWRLWIKHNSRLIALVISPEEAKVFRDLVAPAEGHLLAGGALPSENPSAKFWTDWAKSFGDSTERVQIVEQPGQGKIFAAFYPSTRFGFQVVIAWPEELVQGQWRRVEQRTRALAGLVLVIVGFLSIFLVRRALAPLEILDAATVRLSQGEFNLSFGEKSGDEVGRLMGSFELMGAKIETLMKDSVAAARMDVELRAAQMVQAMYQPSDQLDFGPVTIVGRSQSANECGGDLWSAWQTEENVYVVVADATGHGVSAALLTAAMKSVVSILEATGSDDLDMMMKWLRRAIRDVGRGQIMMTGYLIQIGKKTGMIKTFNAGHHEIFIFPRDLDEKTKWKDLKLIFEPSNASLGSTAEETNLVGHHWLDSGDRIVVFTDGISDIEDEKAERWKDRAFLKMILDEIKALPSPTISAIFTSVWGRVRERMGDRPLVDDVTLVMIDWQRTGPAN